MTANPHPPAEGELREAETFRRCVANVGYPASLEVGQVPGYGLAGVMELRIAKEEFSRAYLLWTLAKKRLDAAENDYLDALESSRRLDRGAGMSHFYEGPSRKTYFNYNSDLSGNVAINVDDENGSRAISVPGVDLLAFVAEYVRRRRISALESAEWHEVLGVSEEWVGRMDEGGA